MDSGEEIHCTVDFCPLLCHHICKCLGFSVLLKTTPVDSVQLLGLALPTFVALVLLPTQLMLLPE